MKNVLMILLSAALVLSFAGAVSATNTFETTASSYDGQNIEVTYDSSESLIVTYPSEIVLGGVNTPVNAGNLTVQYSTSAHGKSASFKVTIESTNTWNVVSGNYKIPYTLKFTKEAGNALDGETNASSKTLELTTKGSNMQLHDWSISATRNAVAPAPASYSDTLTFNIEVTESGVTT